MRRGVAGTMLVAVAAAWAGPAATSAQDDQRPRISATPRMVTYGETVTVDARLIDGAEQAGTPVALLERRLPGDGRYREIHRARADEDGAVRYEVQPGGNAYFAVKTRTEPPQTSLGLLVEVRPRIAVSASTTRPQPGGMVTFSGSIEPGMAGGEVVAQRRGKKGWKTVGATTATAGSGSGAEESRYSVELRARRGGSYRIVVPASEALARGASERVRLRVAR